MFGNRKMLPVRVLKIWFDVVLALGTVAALLLLIWLVLSPFVIAEGNVPAEATVTVALGERSWIPVYPLVIEPADPSSTLTIERATLVSGRGDLRLVTRNWRLHFAYLVGILFGTGIVLYGVWTLRRVLVNVLDNRPFDAENARLLSRCGYLILLVGAVYPPYAYLLSRWVVFRLVVGNLTLSPAITFDKDVFVVGLLFLVFGFILERGYQIRQHELELEEEQALTI